MSEITEVVVNTTGITPLTAGRKATWFVCPCCRDGVQLIQVNEDPANTGAHLSVLHPGEYSIGHVAGEDIQWITVRAGHKPAGGVLAGIWGKVSGFLSGALGWAKAAATSHVGHIVIAVALTAGGFLLTSQQQGCDLSWPDVLRPSSGYGKAVREAFASETEPDKADSAAKLATVYRLGATASDDPTAKTTGDIYSQMTRKSFDIGVKGKIKSTQETAISPEWKKRVPEDTGTALTPDIRKGMKAYFTETATILEGLK